MKLLIITQKVDRKDPVLGFFHDWILGLSKKFEKISVICLEKGEYNLPESIKVYSLGKESGRNKIKYVKNFVNFILGLHRDYDAVFVHMNQEYILIGGFIWKILRKKIYFWRNHQQGNLFTRIAVWFSNKVFCTSKDAFVAKYKKTDLMPVGINIDEFVKFESLKVHKVKNSVLFLSRIAPIKKPDLLIEALNILNEKGIDFVCDFYGNALTKDQSYFDSLKTRTRKLNLENKINFHEGVPNYKTPKIYNEHEIFVNLTPSGSFDKTILEAAACGCIPIVTNRSLDKEIDEKMIVTKEIPENIAETIDFWMKTSDSEKKAASEKLQKYVSENHSLNKLIIDLEKAIK